MMGDWNPLEEAKAAPETVCIDGIEVRVGDRVLLCPTKKADIMDMALAGKVAVIEAIEQDFEDHIQLAVVLDDDPGREFGMMRQPGHRFFFSPEEVAPVLRFSSQVWATSFWGMTASAWKLHRHSASDIYRKVCQSRILASADLTWPTLCLIPGTG